MVSKEEVEEFLKEFKQKMQIWDVVFLVRDKNTQALADLELRPIDRKKVLEELKVEDYCEGPKEENQFGGSTMWVFGKLVKKKDVYIKVTMGAKDTPTICISFHVAEKKLVYPLK